MQIKNRKKPNCRGNVQEKSRSAKGPKTSKKSIGEHEISSTGYKREIVIIEQNGKVNSSRTVHQRKTLKGDWVVKPQQVIKRDRNFDINKMGVKQNESGKLQERTGIKTKSCK